MEIPEAEKSLLLKWTIKLRDEIPKLEGNIKILEKRLQGLKDESSATEYKIDMVNDIDDPHNRKLVEDFYLADLENEQAEIENEINETIDTIKRSKDNIEAIDIITNKFGSYK